MYLKFHCPLELAQVARLLAPDAAEEHFETVLVGREEQMHFSVPEAPCGLTAVRAPSDASSVIIFGRDPATGDELGVLPDWLAQYVADELLTTVHVYTERFQRDRPESEPAEIVRPHLLA